MARKTACSSKVTLIVLLVVILSVLTAAMLVGCYSSHPIGTIVPSGTSGTTGITGTSGTTAPQNQLVVETKDYTLTLPIEWAESAEVSYEGDKTIVHLKNHKELSLLTVNLVDSSYPMNNGDIGGGCVHRANLSNGKRLEFWGTNWLYILAYDAYRHDGRYDYAGDAGKRALISLTYGKEVDLSKLSKIGENYQGSNYANEYYTHMQNLVKSGLKLKS